MTRVAIVGFGMQYSRYGSGTYLRNLKQALEELGCMVDTYGTNKYPNSKISPFLSLVSSVRMIFLPWWRYDFVLANEGSGAFILSPRKAVIIHHSAMEKARRTRVSLEGLIGWCLQYISIRTASRVVCISKSTFNTIQSYVRNIPVRVIWNGVNHDIFHPLSDEIKNKLGLSGNLTLLYAARASSHKNFEALIKLADLIKYSLTIIILGTDLPSSFLKKLKKHPHVECVNPGYVSTPKLVEYLNATDFYVNVSRLEGFGLVQVEAMACGAIVIAFDSDENKLILDDGGIVVTNLQEMAMEICRIWDEKELMSKMREKAVVRASHFSWKKTAKEIYRFVQ